MIALGEHKIAKMFLGDLKIGKAYLGDELVYQSRKPSRLPEGYTEVEYIEISGAVGFPTATVMNPSTYRIVYDLEASEKKNNEYLFYCAKTSSNQQTYMYRYSATTIRYILGLATSTTSVSLSIPTGKRTTIDVDFYGKQLVIDGVSKTLSIANYTSGAFYLFGGSVPYTCLPCKLYSVKTYISGEPRLDFVPCIRDSDKKPGLYDLTTNAFRAYISGSTGVVTAGPAV